MILPTMWYVRPANAHTLNILNGKLLTKPHLEPLSLKVGRPGSSMSKWHIIGNLMPRLI